MKTLAKILLLSTMACSFLAVLPSSSRANGAIQSASQGGVYWRVPGANGGVSLRVVQPDGSTFEQTYASGQSPLFTSPRGVLADGTYTWELTTAPIVSPEVRAKAQSAREAGQTVALPAGSVESGSFRVAGGVVTLPDASAVEPKSSRPGDPSVPQDTFGTVVIASTAAVISFVDTSVGTFPTRDWRLRANDTFDGGVDRFSIEDLDAGTIPFTIRGTAPTNSLFVASTGRVGFGTGSPLTTLHAVSGNTPTLRLEQNTSGGFSTQTWDVAGNETEFFIRDATNGSQRPFRIKPAAPSDSLFIAVSGNVGVGTSSPSGHLHVRGVGTQLSIFGSSDNGAVQFRLQTDSTNRRFVALNEAGAQQSQLVFGDNGAFDFLGATATDVRMSLRSNGNVGIGTAAPDQKLSVNGNASKPGGGSWLAFSDERLKNIKGQFKSGLDQVMKLQPIRYEYKPDNAIGLKSEGEHIGFGAAAVQKIIPEAVTKNAAGYLMVDNDPILWTMLNAIKEQNAQVQAQNAQLTGQSAEIAELKEQLKRLQAQVVLQAATRTPPQKKSVARTIP